MQFLMFLIQILFYLSSVQLKRVLCLTSVLFYSDSDLVTLNFLF